MAEGEIAVDIKQEQEPPPPYDNENATETNNVENATEANNGEQPSEDENVAWKCLRYLGLTIFYTIIGILFLVALLIYIIIAGAAWLFANIDITELKAGKGEAHQQVQDIQQKAKNDYQKKHGLKELPHGKGTGVISSVNMQKFQNKAQNLKKLPNVIQSRLVIFVFTWVIVNFTVPSLRNKTILETKLWKWTLFVTTVLCGYHIINILSKFVVSALCFTPPFKKKQSWSYYVQGLRESFNLVALAALILLSWVSYFRTTHGIKKTPDTRTFLHVCTWSFVTFAVTAVLWLLKSVLLLKWKADAVYRRFSHRILVAREQVYFLGYILSVLKPTSEEDREKMMLEGVDSDNESTTEDPTTEEPTTEEPTTEDPTTEEPTTKTGSEEQGSSDPPITPSNPAVEGVGAQPGASKVEKTTSTKRKENERKKATQILLSDKSDVNLYDIQKLTEYFVDLFKVASRDDDSTKEIVKQCRRKVNRNVDTDGLIEEVDLINFFDMDEKDAKILYEYLKHTLGSKPISHRNFEKSMVRAHNNCVALGHTLLDAGEVVEVLNNVMVILLFGIVFIAWLLLTDIATTKILVLIASPLLAVTFIFGDTCKKIFEGIIFSFINHPFDVGDRCIIDNNTEVEVRRMSVLTTTFIGIGTKEEVLYPNSALAGVPITNLKGEPDPCDSIELTLDSSYTKSRVAVLDENIKDFFKNDISGKFEKKCSVLVKDIGGGVKMEVQFEHVMSINEITHSQCLKKKGEQKSSLYLHIKECMDKSEQENKELMDKMKKENEIPVAGTSKKTI